MIPIEDRLRDAIAAATGTVSPAVLPRIEETIAHGPAPTARRVWRRWQMAAPIAAAAAVAVIVVLLAMLTPPGATRPHRQGFGPAARGEPKFMITNDTAFSPLLVRNAATGVIVTRVRIPHASSDQHVNGAHAFYLGSVTTSDGRSYQVVVYRLQPCRSWAYQFTLNSKGQPSAVTPLAALSTVRGAVIGALKFSSNRRWLAFISVGSGVGCVKAMPGAQYIGLMNTETGQTKQWTYPANTEIDGLSLSADGSQLLYSYLVDPGAVHEGPSGVRIFPTSAPPGNVAAVGRDVITPGQFGARTQITFAAMTPDGRRAYFSVYPDPGSPSETGQIWGIGLAGGHAHLIARNARGVGVMFAEVHVRYLLIYFHYFSRLNLATGKVTLLPRALWKGPLQVAW
jgi:hypothetical protein